ncbi:MAG: hypothetical protein NTY19_43190, partial [Planctomycetota bacterium]|nr:hypothetical protein [Planctomycetota bacterium]
MRRSLANQAHQKTLGRVVRLVIEMNNNAVKDTPLPPENQDRRSLSASPVWVMAVACGIAVANLYYCQPLLAEIAQQFKVPERQMGIVSALTQVGYALGLLFFVPLGDVLERRGLILAVLSASVFALLAVAMSPSFVWLAVASLALGAATVTPQMIVPLAAGLTDAARTARCRRWPRDEWSVDWHPHFTDGQWLGRRAVRLAVHLLDGCCHKDSSAIDPGPLMLYHRNLTANAESQGSQSCVQSQEDWSSSA